MSRLCPLLRSAIVAIGVIVLGTPVVFPPASAGYKHLQVGTEIPAVEGTDLRSGEKVSSTALADGNVLLIAFWSTWSERSLDLLADLKEMVHRYDGSSFRVLAVNVEGPEVSPIAYRRIEETATELELPFPVIIDEGLEIFNLFGVIAVPSAAVIDASGTLCYDPSGYSHAVRDRLAGFLEVLLGLAEPTDVESMLPGYRPDRKASRYYRLALQMANQGLYERAEANLEQAIQTDPGFAAPHNLRGQISLDLDRDEAGAAAFEKAASLDTASVAAWAGWGRALLRTGNLEAARERLAVAIGLDSAYTPALRDLALCTAELGEDPQGDAIKPLTAALELNPMDATTHYYLGLVYKAYGREREMIDSYRTALEILFPNP